MSIGVTINSVPLELGGIIDTQILGEADFRKAGPLRRLIGKHPVSQTVYTADNCKLECFDGGFAIYPCTHGYLNKDRQWETKAVVFINNGRIHKLEFKVIDGLYAAANFLDRFHEACNAALGDPVKAGRFRTRWKNGAATVSSVLHRDMVNVDFLMEVIQDS